MTQGDPFFQTLGSNGRRCFTCHRPGYGWGFSAGHAQRVFTDSNGTDPLFRVIDGAVCPTDPVGTPAQMQSAYRLLLGQGLIRIGLTVPANPQFSIAVTTDQDGCNLSAATGLSSSTSGTVNVYRRPLQTANLPFLTAIMWDGREASLQHQSVDAAMTHEQAATAPSDSQQSAMVTFESGLFTAQSSDTNAGDLTALGASGGPVALSQQSFSPGVNSPFGANASSFNPAIFNLYSAWATLTGTDATSLAQQSIARGEQIFNSKPITIKGVAGLNDVTNQATIQGTCGSCHNTPNIGNASNPVFLNIGVAGAAPPALNVGSLPLFTLTCTLGPAAGQSFLVTDPGRAMTTGACADIGKTKVPNLRDLAARPPYFHNGSAASLTMWCAFTKNASTFRSPPRNRPIWSIFSRRYDQKA